MNLNFLSSIRALAGAGQAIPPWDDYWYQRPGFDSAAGMAVSPETAMRLSAVFACVRVVSESIASLPLIIYRRLPNGGKERAIDHPLYRVLHDTPNIWQTALEFIEMMQGHLELRGNAFSRILPGPRGAIDQLVPLHPDLVQVYRLPNGRLRYQVRSRWSAEIKNYAQEEIFHLRGLSSDGLVGLSPVAVQRETIGRGLGLQDYGSRFFSNNSVPSGVLTHPGKFKDDNAREKFRESWTKAQTQENQHKVAVLEDGLDYKAIGVSNRDSQFLEAMQATDIQICGMFRVQPHKIGLLDRTTHSNIEAQNIEFVVDTLRTRIVRWERRINVDLIDPLNEVLDGSEYFGEFLVDGLLRGDFKSRMDGYAVGRQWGLLTPNTIARIENWEPIPEDKGGDDYWRPVNMTPTDAPVAAPPGSAAGETPETPDKQVDDPPPQTPDDEGGDSPKAADSKLLKLFAIEAAGRVVRKEVAALRKIASRSPESFNALAADFYKSHASLVAQTMCISPADADRYVAENLKWVSSLTDKEGAIDWLEDTAADELAALALGRAKTGVKNR